MKMKDFLGITDDSWYYYKNQDAEMQAKTRTKIKQNFDVLIKAGKDRSRVIALLSSQWLCDESVVQQAILSPPIVTP